MKIEARQRSPDKDAGNRHYPIGSVPGRIAEVDERGLTRPNRRALAPTERRPAHGLGGTLRRLNRRKSGPVYLVLPLPGGGCMAFDLELMKGDQRKDS